MWMALVGMEPPLHLESHYIVEIIGKVFLMIKFKFHHFCFCLEILSFSVVLNKQIKNSEAKTKLKLVRGII